MKPRALDFDTHRTICIGLSFEQKLILTLIAPDHCWKSVKGTPLSRSVSDWASAKPKGNGLATIVRSKEASTSAP